ncbi:MAG: hypothetical protein OXK82_02040 [Deltaproteobacteria bacterium]|nr:hypothetical protein [Deltaproteobacteria bacterium]
MKRRMNSRQRDRLIRRSWWYCPNCHNDEKSRAALAATLGITISGVAHHVRRLRREGRLPDYSTMKPSRFRVLIDFLRRRLPG